MYAQITEMDYKLSKINKDLNEQKNENIRLSLEIQKHLDLNRIRDVAQTRLDMQKPNKHQIIYVNVPKTDFTELPEKDAYSINEGSLLSYVAGIFNNLFGFIR
jgi:hypothetical protein